MRCLSTGAWVGVWYLAVWWTMPRMLGRPTMVRLCGMVGLAALWVLIEWTRTWLLSGFPWLPLAASQWQRVSMLQIAAYTGEGGISFVLVAVNIGFAAYSHRLFREGATGFNKRSQEFFLALFLVLTCFSVHVQETFNRVNYIVSLGRVAFVQPYIPQAVKWDPARRDGILDVLEKTTAQAAAFHPDLILWPEAVTPLAVKGDPDVQAWTESVAARAHAPLILGSIGVEAGPNGTERWYNGAFVVDPLAGLHPAFYAKRHLVPFGEYIPLKPLLGWLRKAVEIGDDFQPGADASPLIVHIGNQTEVVGPLICYEDTYPQLARRSVLAGANILAVISNNGWFGEGGAAYQHAAHSVLRAVETRRPVLRSGNGGWSGWIDEYGNIRAVLTRDEEGHISTKPSLEDTTIYFRGAAAVNVTRDSRWVDQRSFYVEHGDWFIGVCAALVIFGAAMIGVKPEPASRAPAET